MSKRKIIILTCSALAVILCVLLFMLLNKKTKKQEEPKEVVSQETVVNSKEDIPINFDELRKENDEIYAWIKVIGTKIDYPILQSKDDNSFYLTNDSNKKESISGAIYTQFYNSTDFNDFNTIIYGHNMKNGAMFGDLKRFKEKDFFDKNQIVVIYMPSRVMRYKIFSAYTYDDRHIISEFNFSSIVDRQFYLDSLSQIDDKNAQFRDMNMLNTDDRIITLSTCTAKKKDRFIVQAVLVEDTKF